MLSIHQANALISDWNEHEQERKKTMMSYFLFCLATILAGTINALAGGGVAYSKPV
jgi:hypothetical protein